jgi:hypothetical protein
MQTKKINMDRQDGQDTFNLVNHVNPVKKMHCLYLGKQQKGELYVYS